MQQDPVAEGWRPSRRAMLGAIVLVAGGAAGYGWVMRRPFAGAAMSAPEAHRAAGAGEIWLVDIRRPDEWARTGVPEHAQPIDMRRADFTAALARLRAVDPDRPVALICARGVRSSQLAARLDAAGIGRVVDVPEGMLGAPSGPGWLARGLPVSPPGPA